ncbi:hypothetical protein QTP88_025999 [Uroleucon formosanum]
MSFLSNYAEPQRKIISNISAHKTVEISEEGRHFEVGVSKDGIEFFSEKIESQSGLDDIKGQYVTATAFSSKDTKKNTIIKSSTAKVVAGPMAEYLKTVAAHLQSQRKSQELKDSTLMFFKSLVPDVNKLNPRKQRCFKTKAMELLNSMLDSEENVETINSKDGTKWHFNPPSAPHMSGLWEAAVKSGKHHLLRITGSVKLNFEELTTMLCQIVACLNSRPLTSQSSDPESFAVLTPAHILVGGCLTLLPESQHPERPVNYLKRWQLVQVMTQGFWRPWSSDLSSHGRVGPQLTNYPLRLATWC